MSECSTPSMKDLLPSLLGSHGDASGTAQVRAHVAECASCRSDLALLELVRKAAAPSRPVDTARIVAALPTYRPRWRLAATSPRLRAAAAIIIVVGGVALDYGRRSRPTVDTMLARANSVARPELGIGDSFMDLSDADLREIANELTQLEAVTPAEPEVIDVPAVERAVGSGA